MGFFQIFKWLFGSTKVQKNNFVQNIQTSSDFVQVTEIEKSNGLKKINDADKLFFIERINILQKEDDVKGMITDIKLNTKSKFQSFPKNSEALVFHKKSGMSQSVQQLNIRYNSDTIFNRLEMAKKQNQKISVLYVDKYGRSYLFGENIGLEIFLLEQGHVVMEGIETDVFYRVSDSLANEIMNAAI